MTKGVGVVSMSVWSGVVVVSVSHCRTRWTRVSCRMGEDTVSWWGWRRGSKVGCACGVLKERGVLRHNQKQHCALTSEQPSYVSEVAVNMQAQAVVYML